MSSVKVNGARLYFVSDRRRESYYYPRDTDLYSVALSGGEPGIAAIPAKAPRMTVSVSIANVTSVRASVGSASGNQVKSRSPNRPLSSLPG